MSVTLSELESHLWKAAWLLNGPVETADLKTSIFPLLFFKQLSDENAWEHDAALAKFDGDEESALYPENYRFQVPEVCHWVDIRIVALSAWIKSSADVRTAFAKLPDGASR
jgi:type I restriction enzyme M protein